MPEPDVVDDHDTASVVLSEEIMAGLPEDNPIYDELIARWLGLFDSVPVPPVPDFSDIWEAHPPLDFSTKEVPFSRTDAPNTDPPPATPDWPQLPPTD